MELKPGATLTGVQWQMFEASLVVECVWQEYGFHECVIVHGSEVKEPAYRDGRALSYRTWHIKPASLVEMAAKVRAKLGLDYDVMIQTDDVKVEYLP